MFLEVGMLSSLRRREASSAGATALSSGMNRPRRIGTYTIPLGQRSWLFQQIPANPCAQGTAVHGNVAAKPENRSLATVFEATLTSNLRREQGI